MCDCVFFIRVFQLMWQPLNGGRKTKNLYADHIVFHALHRE